MPSSRGIARPPLHESRCSAFGEPVSRLLCWTGMHLLVKPLTVGVKAPPAHSSPLSINSHPRAMFELLQC